MLFFPTGVARHPRTARNGIVCCCVLRAAYGLATAHAIVNGDDSAVFRYLFLVTLTFDLDLRTRARLCTTYLTAKFDCPMFSRSEVIVRTN